MLPYLRPLIPKKFPRDTSLWRFFQDKLKKKPAVEKQKARPELTGRALLNN
jgi:hypothetical protein